MVRVTGGAGFIGSNLVIDRLEAIGEPLRYGRTKLEGVRAVCRLADALRPDANGARARLITIVRDRSGHDRLYAIDEPRIADEPGWRPRETVARGIRRPVAGYPAHPDWIEGANSGRYGDWMDMNDGSRGAIVE